MQNFLSLTPKRQQINKNKQTPLSQYEKAESVLFQQKQKAVFKKIVIAAENLNSELKCYEWRNSIEKYIVHCYWTCILPLDQNNVLIQTRKKYFPFTGKNLNKISLTQILCILKEILVGFQILYTKFGGFHVQQDFIYFDQNFKIQVWGSSQPSCNSFQLNNQTQHQFVCSILRIFQKHEIKSNIGNQFAYGLQRYEQLSFDIVKQYVDHFVARKQLILNCERSLKEIFSSQRCMKNIWESSEKKSQKAYSLNFIQLPKNNSFEQLDSEREISLMFSNSKKMQRKRNNIFSPLSMKVLKDSDLTTQQTQNLSVSRDRSNSKFQSSKQKLEIFKQILSKKKQNKNYKSHHENQQVYKNLQHKLSATVDQNQVRVQISQFRLKFDHSSESKQTNQKIRNFQIQSEKQINSLSLTPRVDDLFQNTRSVLSDKENTSQKNEKQTLQNGNYIFSGNFLQIQQHQAGIISETQFHTYQNSKTQQKQEFTDFNEDQKGYIFQKPNINIFRMNDNLKNSKMRFYDSLDSIAETKTMTNSIKIGEEIRKKSPVKLQKLGKLQIRLQQSIIEEETFFTEFRKSQIQQN